VSPSFIKPVPKPVFAHGILIKPQSRLGGFTAENALDEVLEGIAVPV